jgi:GDPmannose 4,6-dehydratase
MKMKRKTALITGVTGQDGSYLAEYLVEQGYEVHGLVRRSSSFNTGRIDHLIEHNDLFHWHFGDLTDAVSIRRIIEKTQPSEIYNLAAQSHVRVSFDIPEYTVETIALGTLRLLEAIRDIDTRIKLYQASSSEMFGGKDCPPCGYNENSRFEPRSPYAAAKICAHQLVENYREAFGIFGTCGILFNHESPRRGPTFVTRKITRAIGRILAGKQDKLFLGNLLAKRDWGFAGDYVAAMHAMMQHETPETFVIATGETHSVLEFLKIAFKLAGLNPVDHVEEDERLFRPTEVNVLLGDAHKARTLLNWRPTVNFHQLVELMVKYDVHHETGHSLDWCKQKIQGKI